MQQDNSLFSSLPIALEKETTKMVEMMLDEVGSKIKLVQFTWTGNKTRKGPL